jgi:predicted nucleic acid-binding protein
MTGRRFIDTNVVVYQASIVATAKLSGCVRVLSEDLIAGRDYADVIVINPFAVSAP